MKRLFCLLLCISVLFVSMGTISLAVYEDSLIITKRIEDNWIVDVKGENLPEISDFDNKKYYHQSNEYSLHYDAYSQLDQAQKIIYDAVVANPGKLSITVNFPDGVFSYSNYTQAYLTELMDALCTDRPDIFYYAGYGTNGGSLHSNGKYVKSINYICGVYDSSIYTSSNLTSYYNTLMNKLNSLQFDMSNRYNFIMSVHDYLADTVYYPDLNSSDYKMSAHDAYGALVEGRAVCQGYSDAVKLICDKYNIPCVCISGSSNGGGHMWNAIQMEDGKWYFIDLTWDDQDSRTFYDFFLVGSQSTNVCFGGEKFCDDHVNDADLALPNLQYATTAYDREQNHFTLFNGTYNSHFNDDNGYLYLSVFDYLKTPIYYNGMYSDITPYQGYGFSAELSEGVFKKCTTIICGDPDGSGSYTSNDNRIIKDYIVSDDREADNETAAACDVNCDGYVDALDLALLYTEKLHS